MLLENILPAMPLDINEVIMYVLAGLGIILLVYGVFLETEKRQDLVFLVAAACLLVYALYIDNIIFIVAMSGLLLASLIEFIEILLGIHKDGKYELKKLVRRK